MLPGAHRVAFRRAGKWRIYWRASRQRGAEVLWQCAAPTRREAEQIERDNAPLVAERYAAAAHPRLQKGTVAALVADFRASPDWRELAPRTQDLWRQHLDAITTVFGATSLAGIQRKGARKLIKQWHEGMALTPRKANTALSVLVRLFNYGLDQEDMDRNPAAGISRLEEGESRAAIVWTPEELARLLDVRQKQNARGTVSTAGQPILGPARRRAMRLAYLTGLRREDLVRLRWDEVDFDGAMIRRLTLKSRKKKRVARMNIGPELRALLIEMKPADHARVKSVTVVTTEAGKPYKTASAFASAIDNAFAAADIRHTDGRLKHLHDLRGTRATLKFAEGCSDAEVEAWFGWAPGQGGKMRGVYGDPETIAQAAGKRLRVVG